MFRRGLVHHLCFRLSQRWRILIFLLKQSSCNQTFIFFPSITSMWRLTTFAPLMDRNKKCCGWKVAFLGGFLRLFLVFRTSALLKRRILLAVVPWSEFLRFFYTTKWERKKKMSANCGFRDKEKIFGEMHPRGLFFFSSFLSIQFGFVGASLLNYKEFHTFFTLA